MLEDGAITMEKIAELSDFTFAQLKIYCEKRGLELNKKFANSLELLTPDGKYNYSANPN